VIVVRNVPPELRGVAFAVIVAIWILRIFVHLSDNQPNMRPRISSTTAPTSKAVGSFADSVSPTAQMASVSTVDDAALDLFIRRAHFEAYVTGTECPTQASAPTATRWRLPPREQMRHERHKIDADLPSPAHVTHR
jgi:hypothetical protein